MHSANSRTHDEIGLTQLLKSGEHKWDNLKAKVVAEPDWGKQAELRRKAALADYFFTSIGAVTQNGEMVMNGDSHVW